MATDDRGEATERPGLPDGLIPGRRTPEFSAETVPPALRRDHQTTVWARLEVSAGTLEFIEGDRDPVLATPDRPIVIAPNSPHRVVPSADASFAVQFFVQPSE